MKVHARQVWRETLLIIASTITVASAHAYQPGSFTATPNPVALGGNVTFTYCLPPFPPDWVGPNPQCTDPAWDGYDTTHVWQWPLIGYDTDAGYGDVTIKMGTATGYLSDASPGASITYSSNGFPAELSWAWSGPPSASTQRCVYATFTAKHTEDIYNVVSATYSVYSKNLDTGKTYPCSVQGSAEIGEYLSTTANVVGASPTLSVSPSSLLFDFNGQCPPPSSLSKTITITNTSVNPTCSAPLTGNVRVVPQCPGCDNLFSLAVGGQTSTTKQFSICPGNDQTLSVDVVYTPDPNLDPSSLFDVAANVVVQTNGGNAELPITADNCTLQVYEYGILWDAPYPVTVRDTTTRTHSYTNSDGVTTTDGPITSTSSFESDAISWSLLGRQLIFDLTLCKRDGKWVTARDRLERKLEDPEAKTFEFCPGFNHVAGGGAWYATNAYTLSSDGTFLITGDYTNSEDCTYDYTIESSDATENDETRVLRKETISGEYGINLDTLSGSVKMLSGLSTDTTETSHRTTHVVDDIYIRTSSSSHDQLDGQDSFKMSWSVQPDDYSINLSRVWSPRPDQLEICNAPAATPRKILGLAVGVDDGNGIIEFHGSARAVSDAFGGLPGTQFETLLINPWDANKRQTILNKISDMRTKYNLNEGDLFILYFATHGITEYDPDDPSVALSGDEREIDVDVRDVDAAEPTHWVKSTERRISLFRQITIFQRARRIYK